MKVSLGPLAPHREARQLADGTWRIFVKPPNFIGGAGVTTILTPDEYTQYLRWQNGDLLVQAAFPHFSASKREGLMTGLNDAEFTAATHDIGPTYDSRCYDLADLFLSDTPHLATTSRTDELAALIQRTIEDFIAHEQNNYEPPDPPGFEGGFADNH